MGLVRGLGRPAGPEAADADAEAVGEADVFDDAVVPVPCGEGDFHGGEGMGGGFREDGEGGLVREGLHAGGGVGGLDLVVDAGFQRGVFEIEGGAVDELAVFLFGGAEGELGNWDLLDAPVVADGKGEIALFFREVFGGLDGDVHGAGGVGEEEVPELCGGEEDAGDGVGGGFRRCEEGGGNVIEAELAPGLVQSGGEAGGGRALGKGEVFGDFLGGLFPEDVGEVEGFDGFA